VFRLSPQVRLRRGPDGSCWAFRLDSGEHYELNETAYETLAALARGDDQVSIAHHLAGEYGITSGRTEVDVEELLTTCVDEGLVTREE